LFKSPPSFQIPPPSPKLQPDPEAGSACPCSSERKYRPCIFPAHFPSFPEYAEAQKTLLCKFRFFLQFFPLRSRHPRTIHPTLCTYRNAPPFCSILSAVSFHAPTPPEKARHCWK